MDGPNDISLRFDIIEFLKIFCPLGPSLFVHMHRSWLSANLIWTGFRWEFLMLSIDGNETWVQKDDRQRSRSNLYSEIEIGQT